MRRIGFIGLGIMGKPMCMNLLRAGLEVTAYTRTPEKASEIKPLPEASLRILRQRPGREWSSPW